MSRLLTKTLTKLHKAEVHAEGVLRREYPVGERVRWERNGFHEGVVTQHGYALNIRVKNAKTEKEFWISAHSITKA